MSESQHFKEEGNKLFNEGNYGEALTYYTKALSVSGISNNDKATFLRNRSACFLKLNKHLEAVTDCTGALDICAGDTKALYRRCQAYENLGKYDDAYKDARRLVELEPGNKAIQPLLRQLHCIVQDKINQQSSTDSRVSQMFDLAFKNSSGDEEKRKQAANNLIVLARDPAGAEKIYASNGVRNLVHLLEVEKDKELQLTAIRVIDCLVNDHRDRAIAILEQVTMKKICLMIGLNVEELSTAASHVLKSIIESITNVKHIVEERDKYEAKRKSDPGAKLRPFPFVCQKIDDEGIARVDEMLPQFIRMLTSGKVSSYGRDNILELLTKFITCRDGIGWTKKFIEAQGVQQLLTVAGTVPEHKTIEVTQSSRMLVSLCLSKIYEDLISDKDRDSFTDATNAYFTDMFRDDIMESKLEAVMALSALLQGPSAVGNGVLAKEGVLEMIIAMVESNSSTYVKYAVEALVHSASKKDKCSGVIKQATPILKQLYQSENDSIKVRALVGLCKLGSFGGADASVKSYAEGSNQALAKACRRFLCNPAKDVDLRKWAAEGLAYLTLNAEIKEDLVEDSNALRSLVDLAKVKDKNILYPVAQIFTNLTNSHEKKEIEPELIELAKFSKQHVPEEHEKDKEPYISQRVTALVKNGVVNALVAFSKSESENSNELLSRVFLAICNNPAHRGLVVQQGGVKPLIALANKGTDGGRTCAAHAIAKIAVTQNPEISFPGQRACEVVRPMLQLLLIDKTPIQNLEALMGLTNLASVSDTIRMRIVKEKGFCLIEHFCFDENDTLKCAAVECMCNLVVCEEVRKQFHGENDRVKLIVLYCGMEDDEYDVKLLRAASGTLATLTYDPVICHKVITCTKQWFDILQALAAHELPDIQHRGIFIMLNMISADKEIAERFVSSSMLEVLMAVSKLEEPERRAAAELAEEALKKAAEYKLIKHVSKT